MTTTLKYLATPLIIAVVLCASARGQASRATSQPTTQPTTQQGETGRQSGVSERLVGPSEGKKVDSGPQSPWTQWGRTLGALALVVVLIFLARVMLKRFGPISGPQRRDMLDVLARTSVSARHQLLLVRMGRRVVLVGQGPASLTTLSEVTDADEAAALIEAACKVGLKKAVDNAANREGDA
ncbi:MAG: flagellar biosynthetic protein FliO [Phycisphaerae bacterium]|jgi:flagellar biogenesis protein FliO|nr:flagellar biosynthetic protein FliO [Phycisphaerae bacterium]